MLRGRRGLFITGTDTGVGKTWVAAGLAAWCRSQGINVGVMKPLATGARRAGGRWISDDALFLARACGARDPLRLINPSCYLEPLAPLVAAARAMQAISFEKVNHSFHRLSGCHDFMIVEGIGGLLVPLTQGATVADFARQLALPVVIVARPGLGTINHTLLTLQAARRAKLTIAGVIINHAVPPPKNPMARLAIQTNPAVIEQQGKVAIAGILPYQQKKTAKFLSAWIAKNMDNQWLHRWLAGHPNQ